MSQMQNLGLVKGADGVSPTVIVAEDTDDSYKLSITDKRGTIITPNLKAPDSSSSSGIEEAPKDNKQYARQNGAWSEVEASSGGSYNDTEVRSLITENANDIQTLENGKAEKPRQVQSSDTAPTLNLKNNEEYTFTNPLTSITINTQEGIGSIYFVTNSTFNITLPQSIIWDGGSEPEWKAFSIYVLVYFNGIIMASQGA